MSSGGQGPAITIFNVRYSPNLGDGLLSECLEQALIGCGADAGTTSCDLAARIAYGDVMAGRGTIMKVLDALPGPVRKQAVRAPLALHGAMKWRPHYAAALASSEAVVLGGGNLLADLDLNFPTKIGLSFDEAARRGLPVAIYGVGVSGGWSARGLALAREALAKVDLKAVFVRDEASKALFDELFAAAAGQPAQVVRDPGLLATRTWPAAATADRARPVAGLNVMSHIAIRYHAANAPALSVLDTFYEEVARGLVQAGYEVRAFTNGSPEDKVYLEELRPRLAAAGARFLDQRTPAQLCAHIAAFDVQVAYRMHAVIAAYSYGVPTIALAWDRKLASFMASVGEDARLLDVAATSPADCVAQAIAAHKAGLDPARHQSVLAEAAADVAKLYGCFA